MKLWGGRFEKSTSSFANHFHSSISFDKRLYRQDVEGSRAHAKMLGKQGIITTDDAALIDKGLCEIEQELTEERLQLDEAAEDIHMNIETLLSARIGQAGKRLHTGRSRNDQVALDLRMYVKEEITGIRVLILELIKVLNKLAHAHLDTVLPGYTHLQRAQPTTLAHHLCAYIEMLKRDNERLLDTYKRTDVMPLGSGALAGTTYPLDREFVREELGFAALTNNSLDGVSDRDFCIELLGAISILMMHLSRFCEEIVIWSSHEFKFIELDDSYTTGSSIMPQKKNPDMAELIRGKTGRVYGDLIGLLTVMKGLPLAYNKDLQEDKEAVFDGIDTVKLCLPVFTAMVDTMKVNKDIMRKAASGGFTNATDAADYLVKKGLPFREAHEIIGRLVLYCIKNEKSLEDLSIEEYRSLSETFDQGIYNAITLESCVSSRKLTGGPAKEQVEKLIELNEKYVITQ